VQIDVSTTVTKSCLRKLRRLILETCQVEVSGAADGQKVCAERCDGAGGIAVEAPQTLVLFDQWKERSNRQARAAVSRAARDVARNRHVNSWRKGKKRGSRHGLPSCSHAGCPVFFLAPITVNEGNRDDAIPLEPKKRSSMSQ